MLRSARSVGHPEIEEVLTASGAVLSEGDKQFCESYYSSRESWRQHIETSDLDPFRDGPFRYEAICAPR